MSDVLESKPRWQFSLRSMFGVTALVALCCACTAYRGDWAWLLFLAVALFSGCWGCVVATRRTANRLSSFVTSSVLGGAVGAGLAYAGIGSAWGLFSASSIGHGLDTGIVPAMMFAVIFGVRGVMYGAVVGAFCGIVVAKIKERAAVEDNRPDGDPPEGVDGR